MKIAISGAGIAGPTLAYWLLRGGHEPFLIEHAPALRTGGYIVDFWGVGYEVARRMGLEPAVQESGYRMLEVRMLDGAGRPQGTIPVSVFQALMGGRFTSLPRSALSAAIHGATAGRVETVFGDSLAAIDEHVHGVRIRLASGAEREADLLIGADGLHSAVRGLVFGPESRFERKLGYHVAACELMGYPHRDELVYVGSSLPGRQLSRFTERGNRTLVLFIFADEYLHGPPPADLAGRKAALRRIFAEGGWETPEILRALDGVTELYFDTVSQIRMDTWSRGRVMLIGDAAACVSLLAGEGTGLAMAEAYMLAGELHRAGGDYREAFRRYEAQLRPLLRAKQQAAVRFAPSFAPRTRLGLFVRAQAVRVMGWRPMARLLMGRTLRDDLVLPDYSW